jgi:GTP-binding protein Era
MGKVKTTTKVGKVALVGRPNVGKSTLLNTILQKKVSIVSPKPQTTRSLVETVYNDERGQLFLFDTPGLFISRSQAASFNSVALSSLKHADIALFIVDQTRSWGREDETVFHALQNAGLPLVVAINKLDESIDRSADYISLLTSQAHRVIRLSALKGTHVNDLLQTLFDLSPEGVPDPKLAYLDSPILSQTGSDFLSELIREKLFIFMRQEIPYHVKTRVTHLDENDTTLMVRGQILVSNPRYKGMIIGHNGAMIAKIRKSMEKELGFITQKRASVRLEVVEEE